MLTCGKVFEPKFDEHFHEYTLEGRKIPSVTQILAPLSLESYRNVSPKVLENAANRGSAIHRCIELLVQDDLDQDSVDFEWIPYIESFHSWRSFSRPKFISTEKKLCCKFFAGTIDAICEIDDEIWVIDYKTTKKLMPQVAIQLAGYELLARCSGLYVDAKKIMKRGALQLCDDGTFKFEKYNDLNDYSIFEYLLKIEQWRMKNV